MKEERQSLALTDTSASMLGPECVSSVLSKLFQSKKPKNLETAGFSVVFGNN